MVGKANGWQAFALQAGIEFLLAGEACRLFLHPLGQFVTNLAVLCAGSSRGYGRHANINAHYLLLCFRFLAGFLND